MATFPSVPAGENFWLGADAMVHKLAYPNEPTPGFTARLCVLLILVTFLVLAISVHSSVQWEIRKRLHTKWWLYRVVTRSAGRFIVVNSMTVKELGAAYLIVYGTGQVILTWRGYMLKTSFPLAYDWSEIGVWPFTFFFTWVWTFSSFQTYLLLKDDTSSRWTGRVTNAIFLTWLILGTGGLVVMVGFGCWSNHHVWNLRGNLDAFVEAQKAQWTTGTDDAAAQATAQAMLASFNVAYRKHLKLLGTLWGVYIASQAGVFIVNIATLPLLRSLREQIKASMSQANCVTILSAVDKEHIVHDAHAIEAKPQRMPSLAEVRAMAGRQSSGLEAAKRLRTMNRVALDLQAQIVGILILGLGVMGGCIFFARVFPTIDQRPWVYTEMVLLYPVWSTVTPMCLCFFWFTISSVGELKSHQVTDVNWAPVKPTANHITLMPQPSITRPAFFTRATASTSEGGTDLVSRSRDPLDLLEDDDDEEASFGKVRCDPDPGRDWTRHPVTGEVLSNVSTPDEAARRIAHEED